MGIFGDDKLQDERIAALEEHVRISTRRTSYAVVPGTKYAHRPASSWHEMAGSS